MLIVPYDGESVELTEALKRYNVALPAKECEGGACPIPKPLRMLSASQIKKSIASTLESVSDVERIYVLALNKEDQLSLIEMSQAGDWGNMKRGVVVKIAL